MANGNGSAEANLSWMNLAMRSGKWGIVGVFLAGTGFIAQYIFPASPKIQSLTHGLFYYGVGFALIGLQAHAKRATDLVVTVGAESAIARANLATLMNAATPPVTSVDPTIQREIVKQQNGKH